MAQKLQQLLLDHADERQLQTYQQSLDLPTWQHVAADYIAQRVTTQAEIERVLPHEVA